MKRSLFVLYQILINTWTTVLVIESQEQGNDCLGDVASGSGNESGSGGDEISTYRSCLTTMLNPYEVETQSGSTVSSSASSLFESVFVLSTETTPPFILLSNSASQSSTSTQLFTSISPVIPEINSSVESQSHTIITPTESSFPALLTSLVVAGHDDLTSTLQFSPVQTVFSSTVSVPSTSLASDISSSVYLHTGQSETVAVEIMTTETPNSTPSNSITPSVIRHSAHTIGDPLSSTPSSQPSSSLLPSVSQLARFTSEIASSNTPFSSKTADFNSTTVLPCSSPVTMTLTITAVTETPQPSITTSPAPSLPSSDMATPSPTQTARESSAHMVTQVDTLPTLLPLESPGRSSVIGSTPNVSQDVGGPDVATAGSSTPLLYTAIGGSLGGCILVAVIIIAVIATGTLILRRRRGRRQYIFETGGVVSRRSSMVGDLNAGFYFPFSDTDGHFMTQLSTTSLSAASMTTLTPRGGETSMFDDTLDVAYKTSTFQGSKRVAIRKTGSIDLDAQESSSDGEKHSQSLTVDSDSTEDHSQNRSGNKEESIGVKSVDQNRAVESGSVNQNQSTSDNSGKRLESESEKQEQNSAEEANKASKKPQDSEEKASPTPSPDDTEEESTAKKETSEKDKTTKIELESAEKREVKKSTGEPEEVVKTVKSSPVPPHCDSKTEDCIAVEEVDGKASQPETCVASDSK